MNRTVLRRRLAPLALTAALTAGLAGGLTSCSDDASSEASSGAADDARTHNEADVAFAQQMIPHHQQALEMVDLTEGRALPDDVAALVAGIADAQAPEIATMEGWLTAWEESAPSGEHQGHDMGDMEGMEGMGDMEGMDHSMPGMMTSAQMSQLAQASDRDFTRLWLQMMIEHHRGAIEMARTELDQGEYPPAIALAQSIIDSQTEEIRTMQRLLG